MRPSLRPLLLISLLGISQVLCAEEPVRVFAAASLTNAMNDIAARWQQAGHPAPSLAYGASSTLAKQVEAGAPADISNRPPARRTGTFT